MNLKNKTPLIASLVALLCGIVITMVFMSTIGTRFNSKSSVPQQSAQSVSAEPSTKVVSNIPKIATKKIQSTQNLDTPDIVELTVESVVGISTKRQTTSSRNGDFAEQEVGSGSGIVLSEDGYIITNQHVVENADSIYVTFGTGEKQEVKARLVGSDAIRDVAVIKVEQKALSPIAVGDSDKIRVGQTVLAIGNPLGSLQGSVTQGIISAVNRDINMDGNTNNFIQTDAAINPGNSGGALVDQQGQVVAMNTLKSIVAGYDSSGKAIASEGIGFAIPINDAVEIANEIIKFGKYARPGIGISIYPISAEEAIMAKVQRGLLVKSVTQGGAAQAAGIYPNDIITKLNKKNILTTQEFRDIITKSKVGETITVSLWREDPQYGNSQEIDVEVVVGDINEMNAKEKKETQQNTFNFEEKTNEFPWSLLP